MPFKKKPEIYNVWQSMKDRCYNPKNRAYHRYGGRGITVCDRWKNSYLNFAADMLPRPEGTSLERVNNDGDYSPENCVWADKKTQQRNQVRAVYVSIEGKKYRAIELAEKIGVKTDTIIDRAKRGLPYKKVMSKKPLRDLSGLAIGGYYNGKRQKAKTHCPEGHKYSPDNILASKHGWRRCKECHKIRQRKRMEQKKAATT